MARAKVNQYSTVFKQSSAKLAAELEQPIVQIARDLGVTTNRLDV